MLAYSELAYKGSAGKAGRALAAVSQGRRGVVPQLAGKLCAGGLCLWQCAPTSQKGQPKAQGGMKRGARRVILHSETSRFTLQKGLSRSAKQAILV